MYTRYRIKNNMDTIKINKTHIVIRNKIYAALRNKTYTSCRIKNMDTRKKKNTLQQVTKCRPG